MLLKNRLSGVHFWFSHTLTTLNKNMISGIQILFLKIEKTITKKHKILYH